MWNTLQLSIFISSLVYSVHSFIDDLNLNYETLRSNKEGRHFLVTTLLEKLYQPLNEPRFQGRGVQASKADHFKLENCCNNNHC